MAMCNSTCLAGCQQIRVNLFQPVRCWRFQISNQILNFSNYLWKMTWTDDFDLHHVCIGNLHKKHLWNMIGKWQNIKFWYSVIGKYHSSFEAQILATSANLPEAAGDRSGGNICGRSFAKWKHIVFQFFKGILPNFE